MPKMILSMMVIIGTGFLTTDAMAGKKQAPDALDRVLRSGGITLPSSCQTFKNAKALKARRQVWQKAIKHASKKQPAQLHQWIIGGRKPPKIAIEESTYQRDCMLAQLTAQAAKRKTKLLLDFGASVSPTKSNMRAWAKHIGRTSQRRRIGSRLTKSHIRDAASQSFIWRRKFLFLHPNNFNHISSAAAKTCKLTAGHSWRPKSRRHKYCWQRKLNDHGRQREILTASSAPGISRHHWGTDFDLFNLNPRKYLGKGPYADEYLWMTGNALTHGFYQPFTGPKKLGQHTYIEERWHWSYYPAAKAITNYITNHPKAVSKALFAQWDTFEKKWNGRKKKGADYFGYVKTHWKAYMLKVSPIELSYAPWLPSYWFASPHILIQSGCEHG